MSLKSKLQEFSQSCEELLNVIKDQPALLTSKERLEIEVNVTRILSALIQAEQTNRKGS